jgi:uncharacterized membrane protein (DUF4010 family)
MTFDEIFLGFLVALAAGALIGLEREQSRALDKRPTLGGVRTFPLLALSGALSALLAQTAGYWLIVGSLLVVGAFLTVVRYQDFSKDSSIGITTEVAALITFLLGVLALMPGLPPDVGHRYLLIVASAGVVMALLSFKKPLHEVVQRVSDDDLYATAKFIILALVILPLLPDRTFDPWHVLNPFEIGLMVVLIAGISFLGYVATRVVSPDKGLAATGLLGGLVSSTAVTVSLASRVREDPKVLPQAATAILMASATMFLRMLVVVGIVDPALLSLLAGPLMSMMLAAYAAAWFRYSQSRSHAGGAPSVSHRNPFELRSAMKFGALYAIVLVLAKAAQAALGDQGLYASAVLAGLHDVDALTLSMARFHHEGLAASTAAGAITLAAITNTAVKAGLTWWLAGRRLGWAVGIGLLGALGAGCLVLFMVM